jgi:hypothetical protein
MQRRFCEAWKSLDGLREQGGERVIVHYFFAENMLVNSSVSADYRCEVYGRIADAQMGYDDRPGLRFTQCAEALPSNTGTPRNASVRRFSCNEITKYSRYK